MAMMTGMMVKAPCSVCTISRVAGQDSLPYQVPTNQAEPPALSTPMPSSTKNAGLRKTKPMSNRTIAHSWARRVAASWRGLASGALRGGAAGATAGSACSGVAAVAVARCSK